MNRRSNERENNIFAFEQVNTPVAAENGIQHADRSLIDNGIVLVGIACVMAIMDGIFLFDMFDKVMAQNAMLGRAGTVLIALVLNLSPLVIAKYVNDARYRLDRNAWIFAAIGIALFTLLYVGVVALRMNCVDMYITNSNKGLTDTTGFYVVNTEPSAEDKARGLMMAVLLSIEPLVTSGVSFILAIRSDNPVRKKIESLKTRLVEITVGHNKVVTALASMEDDREFLLRNDLELFETARKALKEEAERLKAESRMMLAEKLADPDAISTLSKGEKAQSVQEGSRGIADLRESEREQIVIDPAERSIA